MIVECTLGLVRVIISVFIRCFTAHQHDEKNQPQVATTRGPLEPIGPRPSPSVSFTDI